MADVRVEIFESGPAAAQADAVAEIWSDAFDPIDDLDEWRETTFDRHRRREAYRLVVAFDVNRPVGFSWGYVGQRGQFWPDRVLDRLGQVAEHWVGGHVEFVELAVSRPARRRGVGGRLHDTLLAALPNRHALLATSSDSDDPAVRLYRSRGWARLGLLESDAQVMLRPPDPARQSQPATTSRPRVVCLCGSLRFDDLFRSERQRLTALGVIVLAPEAIGDEPTSSKRAALGELHLRRIDLADEIRVVSKGGYVGSATRREIEYAQTQGKVITSVETLAL